MFVSIVIPAYNEEDNIVTVVETLKAVKMPEFVEKIEIILIDDCSTDETWNIMNQIVAQDANIIALHSEVNSGKGAAVKYAFTVAKGDVLVVQDADTELIPSDIPSLLEAMVKLKVEFINGSRYLPGIVRPISSYKRYVANRLFTFITSILIDVKLTDMACGYKVIHKNLYNQLKIKNNRFGFEAELIIKAMRVKKNNVAEVPVNYFPRNNGEGKKFKNSDGLKILWTVIKYGLFRKN
ncbi:MAG: glycosyltransferase family 2 protein [Bacteroidota bacterium]